MRSYIPRLHFAAALGSLLIGVASPVHAADEGGFGGLLQQLFSPSPQSTPPAQQVTPGPDPLVSAPRLVSPDKPARRSASPRLNVRTRYAALPQAEPLKVRISDRQVPIDMSKGPTAALLKDDTLRPGDIVVMPGGARVFSGEPGKSHKMRDFERIEQSQLVDRKTRNLLAAMMVPIGALPAQEARKAMARARHYRLPDTTPETTSVQASAASLRVVYPWTTAP